MADFVGNVPPHSVEAEQYVLSCCMAADALGSRGRDIAASAIAKLAPDDFYRGEHRAIFRAVVDLHDKREPVDLLGVRAMLERRKAEVDPYYLVELKGAVPSLEAFEHYAGKVAEYGRRRKLIRLMADSMAKAYDLEVDDPIGEAQAGLLDLALSAPDAGDWKSIEELDALNYSRMQAEQIARAEGKVSHVIEFGYYDLDQTLSVTEGDFLVLAARTGFGKTALAMSFARRIAQRRLVGVFSLEVNELNIARREMAGRAGISVINQMRGNLTDREWDAASAAIAANRGLKLHIRDKARTTIPEMLAACRRLEAKEGEKMGLVVVDYLTLIEAHGKTGSETERASRISRELKLMAGELRCPVLALSQFNRGVDNREGQRPELRDLKQSGSIEQDASVVMFIHRPGHKDGEPMQDGPVELIVAKNRNGPTKTVNLFFSAQSMTFTDVGFHAPPVEEWTYDA